MEVVKKHIVVFLGTLVFPLLLHGQDFSEKLLGRVQSIDMDVADVYVINTSSKKSTITDVEGDFAIPVRLKDTLVFSSVQFKRKEIVITREVLTAKFLLVPLEEGVTELNEVVVMPYKLTGDLTKDTKTERVATASSLGLPNAYVIPKTQSERLLYTAKTWLPNGQLCLDPAINWLSGRTLMLRKRVARDQHQELLQGLERFYPDSLLVSTLEIPETKILDFIYFCEIDPTFDNLVDLDDKLKLLEFFRKKSREYLALAQASATKGDF